MVREEPIEAEESVPMPLPPGASRRARFVRRALSGVAAVLAIVLTGTVVWYVVGPNKSQNTAQQTESAGEGDTSVLPEPVGKASPSASAKPSASPAPTKVPPKPGGLDYWPSEKTTGVPKGTTLKPSGSITLTKSGQVVENMEVTGCITVKASNVTIRKTKINAKGCGVKTDLEGTYKNVLIEDVEIDGGGDLSLWLIGWTGFTCRRCYLHGGFSGAHPRSNTVIEDSYINTVVPGGSSEGRHLSGIGFHGGSNMTLRHNRIECTVSGCSAALSLYGNFELVDNVLVEDNYFSGGGYCAYAGSVKSKKFPYARNTRFIRNAFAKTGVGEFPKCGRFGPVASYEAGNGNEFRDNYWFDAKKTPLNL